jgi:cytochrome oxidase assembly protein ShyY1
MTRRPPIVATVIVAAAVALMIVLGVWQLQRAKLHQAQLASYQSAARLPPIIFPAMPIPEGKRPLYRHATGNCLHVVHWRTSVGEDRSGEPGFVVIADCTTGAEGPGMSVEIGWSKNPNARVSWIGGLVSGTIVPDRVSGMRLVAATPANGLEPSAAPQPTVPVTPGRNRGYAATWFALAALALVIYVLALRKRLRESPR